jgi:hypothetical protein
VRYARSVFTKFSSRNSFSSWEGKRWQQILHLDQREDSTLSAYAAAQSHQQETTMSEHGVPVPPLRPVHMTPHELLETTDALRTIARSYAAAYMAGHPEADRWAVFFAALHGLEDGVHSALDEMRPAELSRN